MAINYLVSFGLSSTGPWTAFNTVAATTDVVSSLAAGTNYFFQVITVDTVSGLQGPPIVGGPFQTLGTGTSVSPSGTAIPPATQIIDTNLNKWTLVGGQIGLGGVIDTSTTGVVLLLWFNNLIYQHVVDTAFPAGNWWSSPAMPANSTGGIVWNDIGATDPRPPLGITIATIPTEINNTSFTVTGTVVGFSSTPVLNFQNTINGVAGGWNPLPAAAVLPTSGNSSFSFVNPVIPTVNANNTISVRDTALVATQTSNVFSVITPPTITAVNLVGNTFSASAAIGTTIGTLNATMSNGVFSGAFTLPAGVADDASFKITGNVLSVGATGLSARNYAISVQATQAGVSNSPFTQPGIAITASSGPAVGPAASSTFVTADFTSKPSNAQVVSKYVWGVATSLMSDNSFAICANTAVQAALKPLNFPLYRFNSASLNPWCEAAFGSGTTASDASLHNVIGNLIDNWSKFMPPDARIIIGMGVNPGNNWTQGNFGAMCGNFVRYIMRTNSAATGVPMPVYGFEVGNENNGASWYNGYFTSAAQAVKAANPNYKMFGPVFSFDDNLGGFGAGVGNNCDVLDYHAYNYGGQGEFNSKGGVNAILATQMFSGLGGDLSGFIGSGGNPNAEIFIGEYNQNNTYGTLSGGLSPGVCNTYMQNSVGAVFNANTVLSGLNSTTKFTMGGIWGAYGDSDYGVVGGTDNINGGGNSVAPGGYLLSKGAATMFGPRCNITTGAQAPGALRTLAVSGGPTATSIGLMLINTDPNNAINGVQVALSHWPVNSSGTATINKWLVGPANTTGLLTTLAVTSGLTAAISLPAQSVTILYA